MDCTSNLEGCILAFLYSLTHSMEREKSADISADLRQRRESDQYAENGYFLRLLAVGGLVNAMRVFYRKAVLR